MLWLLVVKVLVIIIYVVASGQNAATASMWGGGADQCDSRLIVD